MIRLYVFASIHLARLWRIATTAERSKPVLIMLTSARWSAL